MMRSARSFYAFVFFLAGTPALLYQVVWQRVLTLYVGVDVYAAAITVSAFMMGLGLGALAGGAVADRLRRLDLGYAFVEGLLALCGWLSVPALGLVGAALGQASLTQIGVAVFFTLALPTFLMGMTLPLLVQALAAKRGRVLGADLAWLYGANTLGAALGAFLGTYWLMGRFGFVGATRIAAGINLGLSILVLVWTRRGSVSSVPHVAPELGPGQTELSFRRLLGLSFLSGAVALGFEVVWYRLLLLLLHGTTYVFGTILGVFLLAMGLGSLHAQRRLDEPGPELRFARCQLGIGLFVLVLFGGLGSFSFLPGLRHLVSASFFLSFHPSPALGGGSTSLVDIYSLLDTFFWPLLLLGTPAYLMGYGFPNLIRAAELARGRVGSSLGAIYATNIAGAILGSLGVGFWALDSIGSEGALLALAVLAGLGALGANLFRALPTPRRVLVAVSLAFLAIFFPRRGELIAALHLADFPSVTFVGREDKVGIVALRRQDAVVAFAEEKVLLGETRLYIDGARHGNVHQDDSIIADVEVQLALGAHPAPQRVLAIGLGDGRMVAAALLSPRVEQVTVVELSSGLRELLASTAAGRILESSPKLRYLNQDGRRYLTAHKQEKFDFIMGWPLHAAHAYSANVYSREFFELVRSRLSPAGLFFTRSVDSYSTAATLAAVFPHLFRVGEIGYVGSQQPFRFSLGRAGLPFEKASALLSGDRTDIVEASFGAPLVTDFHPRSEYYLTYSGRDRLDPRAHRVKLARSASIPQWLDP